jgi:hypothetical protein
LKTAAEWPYKVKGRRSGNLHSKPTEGLMSTKITIQYHDEDVARFHLYYECFDEPIEFVYLELGGIPFEAESSSYLSDSGPSQVAVRIPVKWAHALIVGFQKAMVEAYVPIEVRNRAREVSGTHLSDFLGVPATGRQVKVWGMVLDRLQGGRIKDTRIIMDIFGLMMQLDAFAPKG